jgi:hypothetical protein
MSAYIKPSKGTVIAYAIFCLLVLAEVLVSMFSEFHMNAYGNIRGSGGVFFRFLPGFCLLAFYSYFFYSLLRVGEVRRLAVLIHSCVFVVLGLGLAIPFMGLILSLLTPVSLIYRLLMHHLTSDSAYPAIVLLAIVFSVFNAGLLVATLRGK